MTDFLDQAPLYTAVVLATQVLAAAARPMTIDEIGQAAWQAITPHQRDAALPTVLGAYVQRVQDDIRAHGAQRDAADANLHSYLHDTDEAMAWDAYHDDLEGRTIGKHATGIDRDTLLRILSELELLRHRLDMARAATDAA